MSALALKQEEHVVQSQQITALKDVLADVKGKISEDLMRFRTCCADPRASK